MGKQINDVIVINKEELDLFNNNPNIVVSSVEMDEKNENQLILRFSTDSPSDLYYMGKKAILDQLHT